MKKQKPKLFYGPTNANKQRKQNIPIANIEPIVFKQNQFKSRVETFEIRRKSLRFLHTNGGDGFEQKRKIEKNRIRTE